MHIASGGTIQALAGNLDRALRLFGVGLRRAAPGEVLLRTSELEPLLEVLCRTPAPDVNALPETIVFSCDRALQIEALLRSYLDHVVEAGPVHVLYRTSSEEHATAYLDVMRRLATSGIRWVRQEHRESFRSQLLQLLAGIEADRMLFLVDDDLFVEPLDFGDLAGIELRYSVPSLRMGMNLTYCYTTGQDQQQPPIRPVRLTQSAARIETQENPSAELIEWDWRLGCFDWSYPLSLDGHLFDTAEVCAMSEAISFSSPSTYESQLQRFAPFFLPRIGVCYSKSRLLNIPFNRVQRRYRNRAGTVGAEELLDHWRKGLRIDHESYYGVRNVSAHQDLPLRLSNR
ncbi:hypothetical protein BH23GEM9_BH23GEM9_22930 [soil metagenome]